MGLAAFIAGRFSRYLNSPFSSARPDGAPWDAKSLGNFGEQVAADWLTSHNIKILWRNYRAPLGGEVDIVARHKKVLLFIEVKTRHAGARIRGFDAVTKEKQDLIRRGATDWRELLGCPRIPWRYDVVEVVVAEGEAPRVGWIKNAF